jgi:hypothetical protein
MRLLFVRQSKVHIVAPSPVTHHEPCESSTDNAKAVVGSKFSENTLLAEWLMIFVLDRRALRAPTTVVIQTFTNREYCVTQIVFVRAMLTYLKKFQE